MDTAVAIKHTDSQTVLTPAMMLEKAITQGANVEIMEKLLGLQERWEANQARKAFDAALADIRADLPDIVKSKSVNMGAGKPSYKYEDLSEMIEVLSPAMSQHGLSFRWRTESTSPEAVTVTCILSHRDGHSESTALTAKHDHSGAKNPIQAIGSVVTYLQRYTLKAAFGIAASVDDDAQSASSQRSAPPQPNGKPINYINHLGEAILNFVDNDKDRAQGILKDLTGKGSLKDLTQEQAKKAQADFEEHYLHSNEERLPGSDDL